MLTLLSDCYLVIYIYLGPTNLGRPRNVFKNSRPLGLLQSLMMKEHISGSFFHKKQIRSTPPKLQRQLGVHPLPLYFPNHFIVDFETPKVPVLRLLGFAS